MKKMIFGIGAIFSGIFASICCLGPIVLALFGLSFVGFAQLHKYRPIFIGLSLIFLGLAFYFVYRKREVECEDGTCKIESSSKTTKILLWIITSIVLIAISFLWWYPVLVAKLNAANTTTKQFTSKIKKQDKIDSSDCPVPVTKGKSGNYDITGECCQ